MSEFEAVWNRIITHEGQIFHTITGKPFSYKVTGNIIRVYRNGKLIPISVGLHKNSFAKAYSLRTNGPKDLQDCLPTVYGCSYIWAILNDRRSYGFTKKG